MADIRLLKPIDHTAELSVLRTKKLNFDPQKAAHTEADGWHVDEYAAELPRELPGPPAPGGSWEIACRLVTDYEFVDPRIVRAYFDPGEPAQSRTMLLEVYFWGLRIYAGVRAAGLFDGPATRDGREVRAFAWKYQTLEGHFEMGEISYEVWKWLQSGRIEFRINAFSRRANPHNALVRIGFAVFGRRKQREFARRACERITRLAADALQGPSGGPAFPRPDPQIARRRRIDR